MNSSDTADEPEAPETEHNERSILIECWLSPSCFPARTAMVYTVLMLVYRSPELTPLQFRDHYENKHIPLMKSLTGQYFPLSHARHYIERSGSNNRFSAAVLGGKQSDFEFDCISIMMFENDGGFRKMSDLLASPELAPKVGNDCEAFMDAARTRVVVIGESNETLRD